ncbi:HXXEE domain-containing protein [Humibacillus xanthopallidus]|uniref:Uncharacterized protein with HXXEE motif n=1 Tax=Humibacillus xanthopallidus TaxID=412689 RepID=A0A543HHR9_9MICO|nr:HXXEE domain-containing protein [Humibacillus xanthopallidus]TQM57876.1 uncharacterized protein with HXXEE motif [Humibacillus xanthopallidus]
MRWYLRHWYDVGIAVCILALACGVLIELNTLQRILLLSFAVLMLHEFEEYGWPGGLPTFMNEVVRASRTPDRYPLNQMNSMVVNVLAAYPFYLLPVLFPDVIWLALAPVLFNFLEVLLHCGGGFGKARALYSPGLLSVVPWLVLSIWYLIEVNQQNLITANDWWIGIGYLFAWLIVFLGLVTYVWLADKNSPYRFASEELTRFERYRRFVHAAHQHPQPAPTTGPTL